MHLDKALLLCFTYDKHNEKTYVNLSNNLGLVFIYYNGLLKTSANLTLKHL